MRIAERKQDPEGGGCAGGILQLPKRLYNMTLGKGAQISNKL